jgi:hypothetical protein
MQRLGGADAVQDEEDDHGCYCADGDRVHSLCARIAESQLALEAAEVAEAETGEKGNRQERELSPRLDVRPEPPHLHGEQEGHAEEEGAGEAAQEVG